ncbi:fructose 1,6-bisphosphatase [Candidatus Micrarchaeota archaeon]|nr:fructose 1,6-bisphosphatase [Candidatus Micrarchaeota archaeon]MBI5176788.1 fructose 1,6-bisphosphatase [Candidatus Micrarchaeota archaeon]
MPGEKVTLSVIKADVGGFVGHSAMHPHLPKRARAILAEEKKDGKVADYCVTHCGDDLELILTHRNGEGDEGIHRLAWEVFRSVAETARELALYGAGQDLLKAEFGGSLDGMGPGVAEISFIERKSEPVLVFMADKARRGVWNLPLYKVFADPFNTPGLVIDNYMHEGFEFEILDTQAGKSVRMRTPEESYDLLALAGFSSRFIVKSISKRDGTPAAVSSVSQLSKIAGRYVGHEDPALVVRAQAGLPSVGEILEGFSFPHLVEGWMRGSHIGPLMPVSVAHSTPTRFDGPPRVICLGFQLADGKLSEPRDMFDDISFDTARKAASEAADYIRRHGPFEPHRLADEKMEYSTLPGIISKLAPRMY